MNFVIFNPKKEAERLETIKRKRENFWFNPEYKQ